MKWKTKKWKKKPSPKEGEQRVIKKFLILPLSFNEETRWLCSTKIQQRYREDAIDSGEDGDWGIYVKGGWINVSWG